MSGGLLVAGQNEPDILRIVQFIEDGDHDAAGIPEENFDLLFSQAFDKYVGTAEFHAMYLSMEA
jgi:hypothetical protein